MQSFCQTTNLIIDTSEVVTSEVITEPVTLEEMKNFLRLEGFGTDASNIVPADPLSLNLLEGATTVQSNLLIGATILTLAREGTVYTKSNVVGNLKFTHNTTTGVIAFATVGEAGGETIAISYGTDTTGEENTAFDFDNDLIEELITSAREALEKFTGRSIVPHTWKVLLTNTAGDIELPYSNGVDLTVSGNVLDLLEDSNGDEIDDYTVRGTEFLYLEEPLLEKMTATYSVTPTVPKALKQAIIRDVAYHYENRNDEPGELAAQAIRLAWKYKRASTWLS